MITSIPTPQSVNMALCATADVVVAMIRRLPARPCGAVIGCPCRAVGDQHLWCRNCIATAVADGPPVLQRDDQGWRDRAAA